MSRLAAIALVALVALVLCAGFLERADARLVTRFRAGRATDPTKSKQQSSQGQKGAARDGGAFVPSKPAEFDGMTWEKAKKGNADVLTKYNSYRKNTVIPWMASLKEKLCPSCDVNAVGSTNLKSDLDFTIDGIYADRVAKAFNSEFESAFQTTSAIKFDTNAYGIGWKINRNTYPKGFSIPCFAPDRTVGEPHLVFTFSESTPMASWQNPADSRRQSHVSAFIKLYYFLAELGRADEKGDMATVMCKYHVPPEGESVCGYFHNFIQTVRRLINAPEEVATVAKDKSTSIDRYSNIHSGLNQLKLVVESVKTDLASLMKEPCTNPKFEQFCKEEDHGNAKSPKKVRYFDMDNVAGRNRLYESYLDRIFEVIRRNERGSSQPPAENECLKLQTTINQAMFYAMEAYYTNGAFKHIVLQMQSNLNVQVTRPEYFDSFLENFADFVKETAHVIGHHGDADSYLIDSSKYFYRMLLSAQKILEDAKLGLVDTVSSLSSCLSPHVKALATEVRGKPSNDQVEKIKVESIAGAKKCLADLVKSAKETSASLGRRGKSQQVAKRLSEGDDSVAIPPMHIFDAVSSLATRISAFYFLNHIHDAGLNPYAQPFVPSTKLNPNAPAFVPSKKL